MQEMTFATFHESRRPKVTRVALFSKVWALKTRPYKGGVYERRLQYQ